MQKIVQRNKLELSAAAQSYSVATAMLILDEVSTMVQLDLMTDAMAKQVSKTKLSNEITSELQQCIELCAKLNIDFYDCLSHARIEYDKHQRDDNH